uniref:mitogen-activated protein kinase kinase kinase 20-like n=1 Tax=Erigeron canadensis TaxID=72917 RepID=UPI001CB9765B|nr:mitogen-activated protein kinase kinase kinase 20-like [Erigeron canadensis]
MEWVRGKRIGHGSFATVSLAKPTCQNSEVPSLIAVKSCGVSHSESLVNERLILEQLKDCPEIIQCYGDSITIENGQKLYNVSLEYASGGALSEQVKKLSENNVRRYANSILKGLKYIHQNGFVHCDIKLQNVLLVGTGDVKIADFGLAKKTTLGVTSELKDNNNNKKYEIRGTPIYMAPETVINGEQEAAADIWAVGCLITELITGTPIWDVSDISGLLMKVGVGAEIPEIPAKLSDTGKDFLLKCFVKDPSKRWTAEMLLNHPFVSTVSFEKETENQISPREVFDFPDWESEASTPEIEEFRCGLPATTRLGQLLTDQKPNWSVVSNSWVKVR